MRKMNFSTQEKAKESLKEHEIDKDLYDKLTAEQKETT